MKTWDGRSHIDGVQVGEAQIEALGPHIALSAKLAYVNSKTGTRLGFCHVSSWSPNTLTKLQELLDSMEQDVVESLFEGSASDGVPGTLEDTTDGIPGL